MEQIGNGEAPGDLQGTLHLQVVSANIFYHGDLTVMLCDEWQLRVKGGIQIRLAKFHPDVWQGEGAQPITTFYLSVAEWDFLILSHNRICQGIHLLEARAVQLRGQQAMH